MLSLVDFLWQVLAISGTKQQHQNELLGEGSSKVKLEIHSLLLLLLLLLPLLLLLLLTVLLLPAPRR